jgi:Thioredoxin-like
VGFLSHLKKFFADVNGVHQNKTTDQLRFEIVYVSMDLSKEQYEEHLREIGNWCIIPYGDPRIQ